MGQNGTGNRVGDSEILWEIDLLSSVILGMSSGIHGLGPNSLAKATKSHENGAEDHEEPRASQPSETCLRGVTPSGSPLPEKIKIPRNDHVPVGDGTHGLSRLASRHALHQ